MDFLDQIQLPFGVSFFQQTPHVRTRCIDRNIRSLGMLNNGATIQQTEQQFLLRSRYLVPCDELHNGSILGFKFCFHSGVDVCDQVWRQVVQNFADPLPIFRVLVNFIVNNTQLLSQFRNFEFGSDNCRKFFFGFFSHVESFHGSQDL